VLGLLEYRGAKIADSPERLTIESEAVRTAAREIVRQLVPRR
jgi:hypothetical protein